MSVGADAESPTVCIYVCIYVTLAGSSKPGYKLTRVVNSIVSSFYLLMGGIWVVAK